MCLTCPDKIISNRDDNSLLDGSCPCSPGYLYSPGKVICVKCHYTCENCITLDNKGCLSCPPNSNRISAP